MTTWGEEEGEGTPEVESECLGKEKRNGCVSRDRFCLVWPLT